MRPKWNGATWKRVAFNNPRYVSKRGQTSRRDKPCERSSALPTLQVTVLSGWMSYRILRRKSKKEKRREEYFVLDTAVNSSGSKSSEFYFKSKILMLDRNVPRAKDSDSTALTIDSLPSDNFRSAFILGRERFIAVRISIVSSLNRWNFTIDRRERCETGRLVKKIIETRVVAQLEQLLTES